MRDDSPKMLKKGPPMPDLESEESTEGSGSGRRTYVIKNSDGVYSSTCHKDHGRNGNHGRVPMALLFRGLPCFLLCWFSALTFHFLRLIPEAPDGVRS